MWSQARGERWHDPRAAAWAAAGAGEAGVAAVETRGTEKRLSGTLLARVPPWQQAPAGLGAAVGRGAARCGP